MKNNRERPSSYSGRADLAKVKMESKKRKSSSLGRYLSGLYANLAA